MTSDPILQQLSWYGQRILLFVGAWLVLTLWYWFWLTVHILDWHVLEAIVQGYYVLTGLASLPIRIIGKGCALIALLGVMLSYLAVALWWQRRGQVEFQLRGSRWSEQ